MNGISIINVMNKCYEEIEYYEENISVVEYFMTTKNKKQPSLDESLKPSWVEEVSVNHDAADHLKFLGLGSTW